MAFDSSLTFTVSLTSRSATHDQGCRTMSSPLKLPTVPRVPSSNGFGAQ